MRFFFEKSYKNHKKIEIRRKDSASQKAEIPPNGGFYMPSSKKPPFGGGYGLQ